MSDVLLLGRSGVTAWQEMSVSPAFVFDGLSLLDSSGNEIAYSAAHTWLLDDGRKMLSLSFEADRALTLKAVGRGELILNTGAAIHLNGRSLVVDGRIVLVLDGMGHWNHPSNSRRRFRLVTIE
jgi:hypothetical protein